MFRALAYIYVPILVLVCAISNGLVAQKYNHFVAKFSILEKNTLKDSTSLVYGHISYDLKKNETVYTLTFPQKEVWNFRDSTLTRSGIDSVKTRKEYMDLGKLSIYQKLLTHQLEDFGLEEAGFKMKEMDEIGTKIIIEWEPPKVAASFLDRVITEVENNKLQAVAFIDIDEKPINRTYYQDYIKVNNISVPTRVKSYFKAEKQELFRILNFSEIEIY